MLTAGFINNSNGMSFQLDLFTLGKFSRSELIIFPWSFGFRRPPFFIHLFKGAGQLTKKNRIQPHRKPEPRSLFERLAY